MPRRRKYESRKGFTLVEMIVVLLILAVVTSMAVPAFSRQIDDAKEKKAVTEAQACVTAGTGLGAQLYSTARSTALQNVSTDANTSDAVTAALAGWASQVKDGGPALTGDLALTEGQGQYYLKPGQLQNGTAAGADKLKAAAGVDGTVENFWCSGTGQIVYLSYRSADGILVAYTNNGTSGSNITIPTPDVPKPDPNPPTVEPDKPDPEPDPDPDPDPDSSTAQIKIYCYNEDGKKLDGVSLFLNAYGYNNLNSLTTPTWSSTSANAKTFSIGSTTSATELQTGIDYYIVETGMPNYYQRVLKRGFKIEGNNATGYWLSTVPAWDDGSNWRVEVDNSKQPKELVVNIYHNPVQLLTIHKQALDGTPLANAVFTITNRWTDKAPFSRVIETDQYGNATIPLEYTLSDSNSWYNPLFNGLVNTQYATYTLTETTPPSGYTASSPAYFTIDWDSKSGSYTVNTPPGETLPADITLSGTTFTVTDQPTPCNVSITKEKYNLDKNNKPTTKTSALPGATLAILDADANEVVHWTSTSEAKTIQLQPGRYTLREIAAPSKYLQASDIPFTIKSGQKSFTLKMMDPSIKDETQDGNISGDDFNASFNAKSWAHKLTNDGKGSGTSWNLKLSSELLLWNGELYYNYKQLDNIPNEKQQHYADYFAAHGVMPDDALDPIAYLDALYNQNSANVPTPGSSYVVKITGNIRGWTAGQNTFNKGDILIVTRVKTDDKGVTTTTYKPFVFLGDDNSTVIIPTSYTNDGDMANLHFASMNQNVLNITPAS